MTIGRRPALWLFVLSLMTVVGAFPFVGCAEPQIPTLEVTPQTSALTTGQTVQLAVGRRYPLGTFEDVTGSVQYASTNPAVATVTERGFVTAGAQAGIAVVHVTDEDKLASASFTITVNAPQVTSIEVTPAEGTVLAQGSSHAFTATAQWTNGSRSDVTSTVRWSSSNDSIASVGDRGAVNAVRAGEADIVATDPSSGTSGRAHVLVQGGGAVAVKAIVVTPNPGTVLVGSNVQFSAVGVLGDGSTRDMTAEVVWSSSREDLATIDAHGLAKGMAKGEVLVTAQRSPPNGTIRTSTSLKVE